MERDRGLRLDKSPPAVLVRARGEVADRPVMSSCYHNRQGHVSEAFVAEQTQWLHVFIDVAPDVSEEAASFGPRCWAGGSVSSGRLTRSSAASPTSRRLLHTPTDRRPRPSDPFRS